MKSLMRRIDLFLYKHPKFGIKNLMLYIVIGNMACYIVSLMDTAELLASIMAFNAEAVFARGEVWRLVTFVFVPGSLGIDNLLWFVLEIYVFYSIGRLVESAFGKGKFTIFYFSGLLLTVLYGIFLWLALGVGVSLTPLFFNLSLFFAFATYYPDAIFRLFFIIPVKAKWIAWAEVAYFAFILLSAPPFLKLLPVLALLNYILFCGDWLLERMKPKNVRARQTQMEHAINFKAAAKKFNKEQAKVPYTRRCEVCGKTDADNPDLEFRFCSRCGGYHCFCIEHINNHVHFSE